MRVLLCCLLVGACGGKPAPEKATPAAPGAPPMRVFDRTLHAIDVNGTRLTYRLSVTAAPRRSSSCTARWAI